MKYSRVIAAIASAGSLFVMSSAHAIIPVIAVVAAGVGGAALGTAAVESRPPAVAVVPANSTVVMGGPPAPVVQEVIPAPRDGFRWERGHFEARNGVSTWVSGHWIASDVTIDEQH